MQGLNECHEYTTGDEYTTNKDYLAIFRGSGNLSRRYGDHVWVDGQAKERDRVRG